jgi:hypothetical protein
MLQFANRSPYAATMLILPDRAGIESLLVVVKGTFDLATGSRAADQEPLIEADTWSGEPGRSELLAAHDLALEKPGTDVLVVGDVVAPAGREVTSLEVALRVGPLRKEWRVVGERQWRRTWLGWRPTPPAPFTRVPLRWELAAGGHDVDPADPHNPALAVCDRRNPVGIGLHHPHQRAAWRGAPLPRFEPLAQPIRRRRDRPEPINAGPIAPTWMPRASYAGTYDAAWQQRRAPFLPTDFDPRFFQAAPPDQIITPHLQGGEPILLSGFSPAGEVRATVPSAKPAAVLRWQDGTTQALPLILDTLVLQPQAGRCTATWRGLVPLGTRTFQVSEIALDVPEAARG